MLTKFPSNSDFRLFVIVVCVLSLNFTLKRIPRKLKCNLKEAGYALVLLLMYIEACEEVFLQHALFSHVCNRRLYIISVEARVNADMRVV